MGDKGYSMPTTFNLCQDPCEQIQPAGEQEDLIGSEAPCPVFSPKIEITRSRPGLAVLLEAKVINVIRKEPDRFDQRVADGRR